ncbi:pyridoxamine 5'-phosphate oxidase family protein [Candidatus Leptofilum sp.]|uniref:pyridoxamine 5'-phosphate oxidase family protein n=1 Tax=Candidatus Leptofilum sp. TaxID=3241576 RepID=UPI003B5C9ECC
MSWQLFSQENPQLAQFGEQRFASRVAYLATIRKDGSPRVHPVTPIVGQGRLFLFMEPTSFKGHDLRRDGRYALHCAVEDANGGEGEFFINGQAIPIDDPAIRALAVELASYSPAERYVLFELNVAYAMSVEYDDNKVNRQSWRKTQS